MKDWIRELFCNHHFILIHVLDSKFFSGYKIKHSLCSKCRTITVEGIHLNIIIINND